jgi:hypothetical protein
VTSGQIAAAALVFGGAASGLCGLAAAIVSRRSGARMRRRARLLEVRLETLAPWPSTTAPPTPANDRFPDPAA